VVLTVPSLGGYEPQPYATAVFENWKPGAKDKDNGVIFLIAPNDRKMFINTGYGVEGDVPDATAHAIYEGVRDLLRAGRIQDGLLLGTRQIADALAPRYGVALSDSVSVETSPPAPPRR